jgi:APA family basic amino acid/polyamine antiporter
MGPLQLVAFCVGGIIGAGIFTLTGIAAATKAGPALTLSFVLAAIGCGFAGLCFSEFSTMIPIAGSAYTYTYATMGELLAWIIGWDLVLEYAVGAATVSIGWSSTLVALLHQFRINLSPFLLASPWQQVRLGDGSVVHGAINLPAVSIIVLISLLLIKGIQESSTVNAIIVSLKVSVIVLFIAIGWKFIQSSNLNRQ